MNNIVFPDPSLCWEFVCFRLTQVWCSTYCPNCWVICAASCCHDCWVHMCSCMPSRLLSSHVQPHAVPIAEFICSVTCVSTAVSWSCGAALLCQRQRIFLVSYYLCLTLFLPLLPQWSGSLGRRGYSTPLTFKAEYSAVSCCLHIGQL